MEWFSAGKVRPSISERVPLGEATAVRKRLIHRRVKGKAVDGKPHVTSQSEGRVGPRSKLTAIK